MANFTAKVRVDYRDIDGLVLDCRDVDLPLNAGTHTGASNSSILEDSTKSWEQNSLVGGKVFNLTDGSSGIITANTSDTVTATLSGGGEDDWDNGDSYAIMLPSFEWINRAPSARPVFVGEHTGLDNASVLADNQAYWRPDQLVGCIIHNRTDGSKGLITGNSENSISAVLSGGTDNDWDTGDEYTIYTPRFGNPYQDAVANCPVVTESAGRKILTFTRASSHFLKIPLEYTTMTSPWTVAFEFIKGSDTSNQQAIIVLGDWTTDVGIYRRDSSGNYAYTWLSGSGDMADGVWMLNYSGTTSAKLFKNGVEQLSGSALEVDIAASLSAAGFIGSNNGAGWFADMVLKNVHVWNRRLSPIEVDFAFQTLQAAGADYSTVDRVPFIRKPWTDDVSDYSRVNPTENAAQKFLLGEFYIGHECRVQVSGMVGGKTLPDSELGGDLFTIEPIEVPNVLGMPTIYQDAGWSSVFDIRCADEGHYTYLLSRPNGGGVYLHWDINVEVP